MEVKAQGEGVLWVSQLVIGTARPRAQSLLCWGFSVTSFTVLQTLEGL